MSRRPLHGCRAAVLALLVLGLAAEAPAQDPAAAPSDAEPATERAEVVPSAASLPPRYRRWLDSVAVLISEEERELFLSLSADYRRDAFIDAFWSIRDPDPRTPVNEMRRRFEELTGGSGVGFPGDDARLVVYLLNGPPTGWTLPDGRAVARCFARSAELEIWFYQGSQRTARRFAVVFQKPSQETPYRIWREGESLRPVQRRNLPTTEVSALCAEELFNYARSENTRVSNYDRLLDEVSTPPKPPPEWLASLRIGATELPEGADTFEVSSVVRYPARRQSRTAVEVSVRVPEEAGLSRDFDGQPFHHFLLAGEILADDELFESFRYRFEGPTPDVDELPLGFTRFLRPGEYTLRVLVEDVFGERYAQVVRELDVPRPDGLPEDEPERTLADFTGGGSPLELLTPGGSVQVGLVRFTARARRELDRVAFFLDGRQVLAKRNPPYSVELDLGETPESHRVRVVGYVGDEEVATDQIWLNQGVQRFRVRIVEPRPGGIYPESVGARIDVETPSGEAPERVELYVGDQLVGALTQPPYAAGLRLRPDRAAVIKAVAYLADGSRAEDAVIVNTAGFVEQIEVELVERLIAVTDVDGKPIRDLEASEVRVFEDGVEQTLQRFAPAAEEPLHAALVIDRSASMAETLPIVEQAASDLSRELLATEDDRVAVLSFSDRVTVDRAFTARPAEVERALAGLRAEGRTALWDAVAQALVQLDDTSGARALVLFTDGADAATSTGGASVDEVSSITFEQALATARDAALPIYPVALASAFERDGDRRSLERLAEASGGLAFFAPDARRLPEVFEQIGEELRSRYLVSYQREGASDDGESPEVRIEVTRPGARVGVGS